MEAKRDSENCLQLMDFEAFKKSEVFELLAFNVMNARIKRYPPSAIWVARLML